MNCCTIIIDNSNLTDGATETTIFVKFDTFYFAFYITELLLKVIGLGFIMNKGAYLSDDWNKLDFFIISTAIINRVVSEYGINLRAVRALRVLRPLKMIATLKSLQTILESLFSALPLLADSFLILCFCYLLYALAGLQLFAGLLKKRCIYQITGLIVSKDALCGNVQCGEDQICGKLLENPNFGLMNFDDIFYSFLNVFQIVTMDNWTSIMYSIQKTFTNFVSVYFLSLVIIGGLFIVNLTLAIIKYKFSNIKTTDNDDIERKKKNLIVTYDYLKLKNKKFWVPYKHRDSMNQGLKSSLEKLSIKTAKSSKKSNNIFSIHLLSQLKTEIGKFTKEVGSYAKEIGKGTLQLGKTVGKTVGMDKLFKAVNKLSPINLLKLQKGDVIMPNDENNIENMQLKYLKLKINSEKTYLSSSQIDIYEVNKPVFKKKGFVVLGKTFKHSRRKGIILWNRKENKCYRIPKHVKKEKALYNCMKLAIQKIKSPIKIQKITESKAMEIYPVDRKTKTKRTSIKKKTITQGNISIGNMGYHEISIKLKEEMVFDRERIEVMENAFFNNTEVFLSLQVVFVF